MSARRPTLERFIDAVQASAGSDSDQRTAAALLQRAAPVARAILLTDHVLAGPNACEALDRFIDAEAARARRATPDPTDPDDGAAQAAAREDAIYYAALCVGLLLKDVL